MIAYYRFDETSGTVLPDLTGNGLDGTLTNMAGTEWTASGAFTIPAFNVKINEVVTDPATDWSTNGFDGTDGGGTVSDIDQYVELYVGEAGLDFTTGWSLEIYEDDGSTLRFSGDLTSTGAFDVVTYFTSGSGTISNSEVGDYIILGNPDGSSTLVNNVDVVLRNGSEIDRVDLGGTSGQAPNGASSGTADESVSRKPDGADSDLDDVDFQKAAATPGTTNDNNALSFDGAGYVEVPHAAQLDFSGNFTVEAWIKPDGSASAQGIVSKFNDQMVLWLDGSTLRYNLGGGAQANCGSIAANVWTHVALTYGGTDARVYINGELVHSNPESQPATSVRNIFIGSWDQSEFASRNFHGLIDEVRIWNVERSQGDIVTNAYNSITSDPNLVASYTFSSSLGDAIDVAGSNDGTLNGSVSYVLSDAWAADVFPPIFEGIYPTADTETIDGFDINVQLNEGSSQVAYSILANPSSAPALDDIGTVGDAAGIITVTDASTFYNETVSGLSASTNYDIYLLTYDGTANRPIQPTTITATTATLPYLVTNTNTSGPGSLRQAMINANASGNKETITFSLTGGDVINIDDSEGVLPVITTDKGMVIDATTATDWSLSSDKLIVIDGTSLSSTADGAAFRIGATGANVEIYGFKIQGFTQGLNEGVIIEGDNNTFGKIGGENVVVQNNVGILLEGSSNVIQSNYIGRDFADNDLGNLESGIVLPDGASDNQIGGENAGEGNIIFYNGTTASHYGVRVTGSTTLRNKIIGNSMSCNEGGGFDLNNIASTPHNDIVRPTIESISPTEISGIVDPAVAVGSEIHIYESTDACDLKQGITYLGKTTVFDDAGTKRFSYTGTFTSNSYSATLTTTTDGTSEMGTAGYYEVNITEDSGDGSLRKALELSNTIDDQGFFVDFSLGGGGPWQIDLASELPLMQSSFELDGQTQEGFDFDNGKVVTINGASENRILPIQSNSGLDNISIHNLRFIGALNSAISTANTGTGQTNKLSIGDNIFGPNGNGSTDEVLNIQDGSNVSIEANYFGFNHTGLGTSVQLTGSAISIGSFVDSVSIGGNVIGNYSGSAIDLDGINNFAKIEYNVIGLDKDAKEAAPTTSGISDGIVINTSNVVIVGNYIANIQDKAIVNNIFGTSNIAIQGNIIGTDVDGDSHPIGIGIYLDDLSNYSNVVIGGLPSYGNTITNATGEAVFFELDGPIDTEGVRITANSIFGNTAGIVMNGANASVTEPAITSLTSSTVSGTGNNGEIIHLYLGDGSGQPQTFVDSVSVVAGSWSFGSLSLSVNDELVVAASSSTATSEFISATLAPEINVKYAGDPVGNSGTIDLGWSFVSQSGSTEQVDVENTGFGELNISSITGSPAHFAVSNISSTPISGQSAEHFTVQFIPGISGAISETITINNDDTDESVFIIQLEGFGYPDVADSGTALDFDGSNDHVVINPINELSNTDQFTIEGWFKQESLDVTGGMFGQILSTTQMIRARTWSDGYMYLYVHNGSNAYGRFDYSQYVSEDGWFHLAMVYDGNQTGNSNRLTAYVNGEEVILEYSGTIPASTANLAGANFYLAENVNIATAGNHWNGQIDEFRIWKEAVAQVDIQSYMLTNDLTGHPQIVSDDLAAYYRFDEGEGETLFDLSLDNNGVLVNMDQGADWVPSGALGLAPQIVSQTPLPGATEVEPNTTITVIFDQNVQAGAGNIAIRTQDDNIVEQFDVAAAVNFSGTTVTFTPTQLSYNETYSITIPQGAIMNLSGKSIAAITLLTAWSFATQAQSITVTQPTGGEIVEVGETLTIAWSRSGLAANTAEISVVTDAGSTETVIETGNAFSFYGSAGSSTFNWVVDGPVGSGAVIRVKNLDGSEVDESGSFTINAPSIAHVITQDATDCVSPFGAITIGGLLFSTSYDVYYDFESTPQPSESLVSDGSGELLIDFLAIGVYTNIYVELSGQQSNILPGPFEVFDNTDVPVISPTTTPNTSCISDNGEISFTISSSLAPTSYTVSVYLDGGGPELFAGSPVSGGAASGTVTGLASGNYTIDVTNDDTGCYNSISGIFIDNTPAPPTINGGAVSILSPSTAGNNDGELDASIATGGNPEDYSFQWYFGSGTSTSLIDFNDPGNGSNPDGSTTQTVDGLAAGNYTLVITEIATGCQSAPVTFTLTDPASNPVLTVSDILPNPTTVGVDLSVDLTSDIYFVITQSETVPTETQVLSGTDEFDVAAEFYGVVSFVDGSVSFTIGENNFGPQDQSLTSENTYNVYFVADAGGSYSLVEGGKFTTGVSVSGNTLTTQSFDGFSGTPNTLQTGTFSFTTGTLTLSNARVTDQSGFPLGGTGHAMQLADGGDHFQTLELFDVTRVGFQWRSTDGGPTNIKIVTSADGVTFDNTILYSTTSSLNYEPKAVDFDTPFTGFIRVEVDGGSQLLVDDFYYETLLVVSNPFVTTWTAMEGTITIPTNTGSHSYNYDVSWTNITNPGTLEGSLSSQTGDAVLSGLEDGSDYFIEISGQFPAIYFANSAADKDKILTIEQWGDIAWESMQLAFMGCSNLDMAATDYPDLSGVTNMSQMFRATNMNFSGDFSGWDVSTVTDISFMFSSSQFDGDISSWDVSNVTDMSYLFYVNPVFNGNISGWITSNVLNMSRTFSHTSIFNQNIGGWDVSNVTQMEGMFNQSFLFDQDLSSWDVSKVTRMDQMFRDANAFDSDITTWVTSSLTNMSRMFQGADLFNQDISGWDVSLVSTMDNVFNTAPLFDRDLSAWDISSVTDMTSMLDNSGLSVANYDAALAGWSTLEGGEAQIPTTITLGAIGMEYSASGLTSRDALTNSPNFWTISGDSQEVLPAPEIEVIGNGVEIVDGDNTPDIADHTDLGTIPTASTFIRTFTINNTGDASLDLSSGIILDGDGEYSVALQPDASVTGGGNTTFQVEFAPTIAGTFSTDVIIPNDDSDENPYTFNIVATAVESASVTVTSPNGGESFVLGDYITITWDDNGGDPTDEMAIGIFDGFGVSVVSDPSVTVADLNGTFTWQASFSGSDLEVDVENITKAVSDRSDGTFSIDDALFYDISPSLGEEYDLGQTVTISWSEENFQTDEEIEIYVATGFFDGEFWAHDLPGTLITSGTSGMFSGSFDWVSDVAGPELFIFLVNNTRNIDAVSTNPFTVNGAVSNFFEDFVSGLPPEWITNGASWEDNPAFGYQGFEGALRINSGATNFAETPTLENANTISFQYRVHTVNSDGAVFDVYASDDGGSTFTNYLGTASDLTGTYQEFSHTFAGPYTGPIQIIGNGAGDSDIVIDDFASDGTLAGASTTTFEVTTTADDDVTPPAGSLREAILLANDATSDATITFNLTGDGTGMTWTIFPTADLPSVANTNGYKITIEGSSQPGWDRGLDQMIVIDGQSALFSGLNVGGDDVEIFGMKIQGFDYGIYSDAGTVNNVVIGHSSVSGNVISGNTTGIFFQYSNGLTIQDNNIGTDAAGYLAEPNGTGIDLVSLSAEVSNAYIANNIISANTGIGLAIGYGTNIIENNIIGLNTDQASSLPNDVGIYAGGEGFVQTNIIAGNTTAGIVLQSPFNHNNQLVIRANYIGASSSLSQFPNGSGINSESSTGIPNPSFNDPIIIGGESGDENIIAYNNGPAVQLNGDSYLYAQITNNEIYENASGIELLDGADGGQAPPTIDFVGTTTVDGTIGTDATGPATIHVYGVDASGTQGQTPRGSVTVGTGVSNWSVTGSFDDILDPSELTATVTTDDFGTSQFYDPNASAKFIELTNPTGGESLEQDSDITITFNSSGFVNGEDVYFEISEDETNWMTIGSTTFDSEIPEFVWFIEGSTYATGSYVMRVSDFDLEAVFTSGYFDIVEGTGSAVADISEDFDSGLDISPQSTYFLTSGDWTSQNAVSVNDSFKSFGETGDAALIPIGVGNHLTTPELTDIVSIAFEHRANTFNSVGAVYDIYTSSDGGSTFDQLEATVTSFSETFERFTYDFAGAYTGPIRIVYNDFGDSDIIIDNFEAYNDAAGNRGAYALSFDGVDDHVTIASQAAPTGDFSLEAWVYYPGGGDTGYQTILEFENDSPWLGLLNDQLTVYNVGSDPSTFPENQWTHVAAVYHNGTNTFELYVNGEGVLLGADASSATLSGTQLLIGGDTNSGEMFLGSIDEVRIWDIARTQAEIQEDMNKTLDGSENGLLSYFHFDEGPGNTSTYDLVGGLEGPLAIGMDQNTSWVDGFEPFIEEYFNNAMDFDGTDDFISVSHDDALNLVTTDFAIEAWVYLDDNDLETIVSKGDGNGANSPTVYAFQIQSQKIALSLADGVNNEWQLSNTDVSIGEWHHVAVSYNAADNTVSFYLDGVFDGEKTFTTVSSPADFSDNQPMFIGKQGYSCDCNYLDGAIDQLRIWNTHLDGLTILSNMYSIDLNIHPYVSNAVASYQFDDGESEGDNTGVSVVTDASINGFGGSLNGFALTGATSNFVTSGFVDHTPAVPTTQSSSIIVFDVQETTADITWTKGSGDRSVVLIAEGNSGFPDVVDETFLYADPENQYGLGSPTDNGFSAVYNGYGNAVSTSNLNPGTEYIVAVVEVNGPVGFDTYNKNTATNNPVTFTTAAATPPLPPTDFFALENGDGTVTFTWTDNATDETGFIIQESSDAANWSDYSGQLDLDITTFTTEPLSSDYASFWRVQAVKVGASSESNFKWAGNIEKPGNALDFDGDDDLVVLSTPFNLDGNFSYEFWIKTTAASVPVLYFHEATAGEGGIVINATGQIDYNATNDEGLTSDFIAGVTAVNDDFWHYVAVTSNGTEINIYVDGNLDANYTPGGDLAIASGEFTVWDHELGNFPALGTTYAGLMDEVRIWDKALTDIEINQNIFETLVGNEAGLVAYYRMDQFSDEVVADHSKGDSHGTWDGSLGALTTPTWVESSAIQDQGLIVSNGNDSGAGSLRQAILNAVDGDVVTFDPAVSSVDLISQIVIDKQIEIISDNNLVLINQVSVNERLFTISTATANVFYENVLFTGGNGVDGAAIYVEDNATAFFIDCEFTGNDAGSGLQGGAIYVEGDGTDPDALALGQVFIFNSTIHNNSAETGGAIANYGNAILHNVTISGNTTTISAAIEEGGGIYHTGNFLEVINGTIMGNAADDNYGGVYAIGGVVNIANTIILNNQATGNSAVSKDIISNTGSINLANSGYNLLGETTLIADDFGPNTTVGLTNTVDISNSVSLALNDGSANANGIPTHDLIEFGLAVDAGSNDLFPNDVYDLDEDADTNELTPVSSEIDGAGYGRFLNNGIDIGAVESGFAGALAVSVSNQSLALGDFEIGPFETDERFFAIAIDHESDVTLDNLDVDLVFSANAEANILDGKADLIIGNTPTFPHGASPQYSAAIDFINETVSFSNMTFEMSGDDVHYVWLVISTDELVNEGETLQVSAVSSIDLVPFTGSLDLTDNITAGSEFTFQNAPGYPYCDPNPSTSATVGPIIGFAGLEEISSPTFADYSTFYNDYTSQSATLSIGNSSSLSFTLDATGGARLKGWIDWNQDLAFDETEVVVNTVTSGSNSAANQTITPPANAVIGSTRMRLIIVASSDPVPDPQDGACSLSVVNGEVEDYTIDVIVAPPLDPADFFTTENPDGSVTMDWTDLADNEDAYRIEQSTDNISWIDHSGALAANTQTYTTASFTEGSAFWWRVVASNAGGESVSASRYAGNIVSPGNALEFDGADDWVDVQEIHDFNTAFTIETWVQRSTNGTSDWIVSVGESPTNANEYLHFGYGAGNQVRLDFFADGVSSTETVTDTDWHHIAVTYDPLNTNNEVALYLDGQPLTIADAAIAPFTGINSFKIGQAFDSEYFNGSIDELRVWSEVRSQTEIQDHMNQTMVGNEAGLAAYFRFDHSGLGDLANYAQANYHGLLQNMDDTDWVASGAMPVIPEILASSSPITESDGSVAIDVTLSEPTTNSVTVDYTTEDGLAVVDDDYTSDSGTITFAAGETSKTVNIAIVDDAIVEVDEDFFVTLSNPTNATILGGGSFSFTISDNDVSNMSVLGVSASESDGTVAMSVSLTNPISEDITVDFVSSDGTAVAGSDYTAASGTLTFPAGSTFETIDILITDDNVVEADESLTLQLSNLQASVLSVNLLAATATLTISDDDASNLSIADVTTSETNGIATIVISLDNPISEDVTIDYITSDIGEASENVDYNGATGTVTIPALSTSQSFDIVINDDSDLETNETFQLLWSNLQASGLNVLLANASSSVTITDDETPDETPPTGYSVSNISVDNVNSEVNFQIDGGELGASYSYEISSDAGGTPVIGSGTVGSDPEFLGPLAITDLDYGNLTISVTLTDAVGNAGDAVTGVAEFLNPDSTPPVVSVDVLATNDATPALSGSIDDNSATITVTVDGNDYTATNNGDGSWTLADNTLTTLADGVYDVQVTATDALSNVGNDATSNELVIDTTAPVVDVSTLVTNDQSPALSGNVDDVSAVVNVTVGGQTVSAANNGDGTWVLADNTLTLLAENVYDVQVQAQDAVGNTGSDATTDELTIDITAPTATVDDLETLDDAPAITGTVSETANSVQVTIQGDTYAAVITGLAWELPDNSITSLEVGVYDVSVQVTDLAGNMGSDGTTDELRILPGPPSAIDATDVQFFSFRANWNTRAGVEAYRIDVAMDPGFSNILENYNNRQSLDNFVDVTDLDYGTTYYYRVRAVLDGDASASSNIIEVTTATDPATAEDEAALLEIYNATAGSQWSPVVNWTEGLPLRDWTNVDMQGSTRAKSVDLNEMGLTGSVPTISAGLESLEVLDLGNNELTEVGDLTGLTSLTSLILVGNKLEFESIETNFDILGVRFNPQDSVGLYGESLWEIREEPYTLSRQISGSNNTYTWYKLDRDGQNPTTVEGVTGPELSLTISSFEDEGYYYAEVTSSVVTTVTLRTQSYFVKVSSLERDRVALTELYNATNGSQWTGGNSGADAWFSSDNVGDWFGVGLTDDQSRVGSIALPSNNLNGAVPSSLADISGLESIDFTNNDIRSFPDMSKVTGLTTLNLSNNRLVFKDILPNVAIENFDYSEQKRFGETVYDTLYAGGDQLLDDFVTKDFGDGTAFQWTFGPYIPGQFYNNNTQPISGATSQSYIIENIDINNQGTYRLVATHPQLPDLTVQSRNQNIMAKTDFKGSVSINNSPVTDGEVVIWRQTPSGPFVREDSTALDASGNYELKEVVLGTFLVVARPNRDLTDYENSIQTYYISAAEYADADELLLEGVTEGINIDLITYEITPPDPVGADISGFMEIDLPDPVDEENGRVNGRRRVKKAGCAMRRFKAQGRPDQDDVEEEIAYYVETDDEGYFNFDGIEDGKYLLTIEFPGVPLAEDAEVVFELGGDRENQVFDVNVLIDDSGINVETEEILYTLKPYIKDIVLYPNPTEGVIGIDYNVYRDIDDLKLQLITTSGHTLIEQNIDHWRGNRHAEMDLTDYAVGVYYLVFTDEAGTFSQHIKVSRK
ncbi:MAG: LamG-like jellyroll fold domain-containing protein [Cyclobacteriaceae bacterium]